MGAFHCRGFSCCGAPGSRRTGFRSCGAWALLLGGIWDLCGAGDKPVSLALQSGVISTGPRGKSPRTFLYFHVFLSLACWVYVLGLCPKMARWQCLNQSLNQFLSLFSLFLRTIMNLWVFMYLTSFNLLADVLLLKL